MHYKLSTPENPREPYSIIFEIEDKKNTFLFYHPTEIMNEVDNINRKLGFFETDVDGEEYVNDNIGWCFELNKTIQPDKIEVFLKQATVHNRPDPENYQVKQKIDQFIAEFAEYLKKFEPLEMPKDGSKSKFKPS